MDFASSRTRIGIVTSYLSSLSSGLADLVWTQFTAVERLCDVRGFGLRDSRIPREPGTAAIWTVFVVKGSLRFGYTPRFSKILNQHGGDPLHCPHFSRY